MICHKCGKPAEKIYISKYNQICSICLNSHTRDKEKRRERGRRYYHKHVFVRLAKGIRRKDKSSLITARDLFGLAKRQRLICPISGRKLTKETISPDHILPISKGGTNDISNIQLVDISVNYAKHYLTQEAFIQLCREIVLFQEK